MNENGITLEELCQYAQEAKEKTEKERLSLKAQKEQDCYKIIRKIIDRLIAKKGDAVTVKKRGTNWFAINEEEYEVLIPISLDDIKEIIDTIPALEARWTDLDNEPITVLEVTFSETKATDIPVTEELRSKIEAITSKKE